MKLCLAALPFLLCVAAHAQTAPLPEFEVASIKPQKWTGTGGFYVMVRGNMLVGEHADLTSLVEFAYDLKDFQLSGGPAWATHGMLDDSVLFQVQAKPPFGLTPTIDQFRQMLQTLLEERFQLQIHHATKQVPVYNLVVANGGPKLKETAGGNKTLHTRSVGRVGLHIDATNITIQDAVEGQLGNYAGRPVIEKTGLTGHYDFSIEWLQDQTGAAGTVGSDLPSYATALQRQLGLRLVSTTAPFETVVIDHAEKPTEN